MKEGIKGIKEKKKKRKENGHKMVKQCYGLNRVTSHFYVDALTLSVRDRDFGRYLDLDEVMRVRHS